MKKKIFSKKYSKACIALGIISAAFGAAYFHERSWVAFLLNSTYFITLSVGATFFLALQYVSGARWSEIIRRIPEALGSYIPVGGLLLLVLFFGMNVLYHWSHTSIKADYLNQPFFFVRLIAVILVWFFFTKILRYNSFKEDIDGDECHRKLNVI